MNAVGYARVSTNEQAESGLSIAAQKRKIMAAAELSDLDVTEILVDNGESAKDMNRPAVRELLARVAAGEVDAVIILKLDRITRSIRDLADLLDQFAKARRADGGRGVDLISTAESLNTTTATGRMIINMMGVFSQWERETIAERTSIAMQELRAQGKSTGRAPFGFEFVDGLRIENEREQEILRKVGELRTAGETWETVADTLTRDGYKTRSNTPYSSQGISQVFKKFHRDNAE